MTAAPANIATALHTAPLAGGKADAGRAGGGANGAAFLAVLDQMLGLATTGKGLPGMAAGKADPLRGAASETLPPWLQAFTEALTDAEAPMPANPQQGETEGTAAEGTAEDANALLAGVVDPTLAATTESEQPQSANNAPVEEAQAPTNRGQAVAAAIADAKAQLAESCEAANKGATGEVVSRVATDHAAGNAPGRGAEDRPAPAERSSLPATSVAQSSPDLAADLTADPDVDGVLAAFARRSAQTGPGSGQQSIINGIGAEASGLARQTAQNADGQTRRRDSELARADATAEKQNGAAGSGRTDSDALTRLLASGQAATKAPLATASGALADGATGADAQPGKPAATAPVLLTINEVASGTPLQTGTATQALATTAAAQAGHAARPDFGAMALRIAHEARDGKQHFEIALDPPELGRVEVRLEFSRDGRMTTHLLVDRSDTLDALARDARGLERALQAQGLKLDDGGVQYQLRDQSAFAQQHNHHDAHDRRDGAGNDGSDPTSIAEPEEPGARRRLVLGGLDVTI
ncbi:flagellar hook-length control protein FliK [Microbaculum marinisediminis]|uniref:Flagellar hook-length control protein FliK n=1 Tax=Microbaculum marinisediminis TaxID=2931392 RepID=A0AAW5QWA3_9HYPH|nr:flagellar hook-length control protein FliK [Microbaculum sp. A6E488]MCT8971799.1 flagellar hook-length control protein FliK [Microbaculum sp. A6E488]